MKFPCWSNKERSSSSHSWARVLLYALVATLVVACHKTRPRGTPSRSHRVDRVERVVSLSPSTTEALFALGAGPRVVGRTRYCDFPPEAVRIPTVGGYVDASVEAIIGLRPDIVVGARGPAGRGIVDQLTALGIETYFPPTESLAEIEAMILGIGDEVGEREHAREVVDRIRARIDRTKRTLGTYPRPRVLLVFARNPIVVAGPDGFPNEVIRLAGGENVIETGGTYPMVNFERLLALDPDIVVDATFRSPDSGALDIDDPGWAELTAVRKKRVVALQEDVLLRPGPRIADGVDVLARTLHPEATIP